MSSTVYTLAMIGGLSGMELALIVLAIVMLFGLGKLPQAAKQLGIGVRNFQKSVRGEDEDEDDPKKLEGEKTTTIPSKEKTPEHVS